MWRSRAGVAVWFTAPCLQCETQTVLGSNPDPAQISTNACTYVCKYVDQKDSAAMQTSMQSEGVAPEELHAGKKARKWEIHPGLKPRHKSAEVQNRGISDPTKRTYVLKIFFKKIMKK